MGKTLLMKRIPNYQGEIIDYADEISLPDNIVLISADLESLVKELREGKFNRRILRKLQQYSVSIYKHEYNKLAEENAVEILENNFSIISNAKYYSSETGLDIFTDDNKNAESYII